MTGGGVGEGASVLAQPVPALHPLPHAPASACCCRARHCCRVAFDAAAAACCRAHMCRIPLRLGLNAWCALPACCPTAVWTSTLQRTIVTASGLPYPKVQWKALDEIQVGPLSLPPFLPPSPCSPVPAYTNHCNQSRLRCRQAPCVP